MQCNSSHMREKEVEKVLIGYDERMGAYCYEQRLNGEVMSVVFEKATPTKTNLVELPKKEVVISKVETVEVQEVNEVDYTFVLNASYILGVISLIGYAAPSILYQSAKIADALAIAADAGSRLVKAGFIFIGYLIGIVVSGYVIILLAKAVKGIPQQEKEVDLIRKEKPRDFSINVIVDSNIGNNNNR